MCNDYADRKFALYNLFHITKEEFFKVFEYFDKVQFIYYNNTPWPKIINNVTSKGTEEFNALST